MKRKKVAVFIMAGMMGLTGCGNAKEEKQEKKDEGEYEMQAYRTPTEREWEILEDCNLSADYMEEIKEKGMSISVQSFVDTAQMMLDYLEEKYGQEFRVSGGTIPGVISGDYSIRAYAEEGEYAENQFDVYYRVDEEGNGYCEDGYFAIIKNDEFQKMMQESADRTGDGWKVFTELSGIYGEEYGKESHIADIAPEDIYADINCIMSPEMSEEEYEEALEKLRQEYGKEKYHLHIFYCQFLKNEDWENADSYRNSTDIIGNDTEENPVYRGRLFE